MEDELKGALCNRGIEAGLCNNCKRKANLTNWVIRKERKGGGGRREVRKEKIGVFGGQEANNDQGLFGKGIYFIFLIYFNCWVTTLQYCGGFCHTLT